MRRNLTRMINRSLTNIFTTSLLRSFAVSCITLVCIAGFLPCFGLEPPNSLVEYTVSFPAPQTQMMNVSIELSDIAENENKVDFVLPTWRPGRYVILDPAGTMREIHAINPTTQEPLTIRKIDKTTWRVATNGQRDIRVTYRIYANSLNDRTRHVDDSHAFLSGSSVFLYNPDRRSNPVRVRFDPLPENWQIATGLDMHQEAEPSESPFVTAPNYDVLVDSPIELGLHDVLNFTVRDAPHEIVIWPTGIDYDRDQLIEDFSKIIEQAHDIFGSFPYKRYVFLMHVGAGAGGGTEHLSSTIMQTRRASLEGSLDNDDTYKRFLGLMSHEYFHTWNVKQIRPAGISPYDYTRENYTTLFWVAEGSTSYYGDLLRVRADLYKPEKYLNRLADSIQFIRTRPGAKVQSLAESSFDAWIKFNRSSPDDVNSEVSFYGKGLLASLLLDLEIRKQTDNRSSLDDVFHDLYQEFRWPGPGYTQDDLKRIIEERTHGDFAEFFARFIEGTDELPFEEALKVAGLELYFQPDKKLNAESDDDENGNVNNANKIDENDDEQVKEEDANTESVPSMKPYLGVDLSSSGNFAKVQAVRSDGPAYEAGLIAGDEIIAMNHRRLASSSDLDNRLKHLHIGDTVEFTIMRRDELRAVHVALIGRPAGTWAIRKLDNPTAEQKAAYQSWLGRSWD